MQTNKPADTAFGVLAAICFCHSINDMLQALLAAIYPTLKVEFHLDFAQIGLVTLSYQLTASLLQPVVGLWADRRPSPFSLPAGTLFTLVGLWILPSARSYWELVAGACVLGVGSSVFHPESSRVARMAAADRPGLAQSLFQVGGNVGSALGPLVVALVLPRHGLRAIAGFSALALLSTGVLTGVASWSRRHGAARLRAEGPGARAHDRLPRGRVTAAMAVLLVLVFSKFVYVASFISYYPLYLMHRFDVSVRSAQLHLSLLLAAVAAGTVAGGPLGDRFGRKLVIWGSILGVLPFTVALPHADLAWTGVLSVVIGFVLASAFPAIVVYGQELLPGRVGMVAGLFFGLSFGAAGIGAALIGRLADAAGIEAVYRWCGYLPALGLLGGLLPSVARRPAAALLPETATPSPAEPATSRVA